MTYYSFENATTVATQSLLIVPVLYAIVATYSSVMTVKLQLQNATITRNATIVAAKNGLQLHNLNYKGGLYIKTVVAICASNYSFNNSNYSYHDLATIVLKLRTIAIVTQKATIDTHYSDYSSRSVTIVTLRQLQLTQSYKYLTLLSSQLQLHLCNQSSFSRDYIYQLQLHCPTIAAPILRLQFCLKTIVLCDNYSCKIQLQFYDYSRNFITIETNFDYSKSFR